MYFEAFWGKGILMHFEGREWAKSLLAANLVELHQLAAEEEATHTLLQAVQLMW